MSPPLRSARLLLRVPGPQDADWLTYHLGSEDIARGLTTVPHPYTRDDAIDWIGRRRSAGGVRIIEHCGSPVGAIGIDPDLAYWLVPEARGRGVAREAAARLVDWWFAAGPGQGAQRIASGYREDNVASAAVLAGLGFRAGSLAPRRCHVDCAQIHVRTMVLARKTWQRRRRLPNLTTARLTLRPIRPSDAPDLAGIGSDPRVAPMIYWATTPWPETEVRAYIERFAWRGEPDFKLALCRDDRLIGTIGLARLGETPEVAYFLAPDEWGHGYMAEGLGQFIGACFDRFGMDAVKAEIYDDNTSSRALALALGFADTGIRASGSTPARLEPAPYRVYRLDRNVFEGRA